ncbi:hypothetical protein OSTOST_05761 [Ostertagia ostertagi]
MDELTSSSSLNSECPFHERERTPIIGIITRVNLVHECNVQLALFRNATQGIGTSHDGASLRREVETAGRACLKACEAAKNCVLPQLRHEVMESWALECYNKIANMEAMLVTLENLITVHFSTSESSPTDKVTPRRRRATSCRPQSQDELRLTTAPPSYDICVPFVRCASARLLVNISIMRLRHGRHHCMCFMDCGYSAQHIASIFCLPGSAHPARPPNRRRRPAVPTDFMCHTRLHGTIRTLRFTVIRRGSCSALPCVATTVAPFFQCVHFCGLLVVVTFLCMFSLLSLNAYTSFRTSGHLARF